MSGEAQSLYVWLLIQQWRNGPLPADPLTIAKVANYQPERFLELWPMIEPKFPIVSGGLRASMPLEEQRSSAKRVRDLRAAGGRKGGRPAAPDEPKKPRKRLLEKPQGFGPNNLKVIRRNLKVVDNLTSRLIPEADQVDRPLTTNPCFLDPTLTPSGNSAKSYPVEVNSLGKGMQGETPFSAEKTFALSPPSSQHEQTHVAGLDLDAWQLWVEYRREIRKPIRPASYPLAQRMFVKFGKDQMAVVRQSIANGWQGLFPLRTNYSGGNIGPVRGNTGNAGRSSRNKFLEAVAQARKLANEDDQGNPL